VALIKKYSLNGQLLEEVVIEDTMLVGEVSSQLIKDYLVAIRANARQWSANTKTRAEVAHSGQKPHPQKGTGRARQGYLGAPQYKGGGRVFSPRPKFNQSVNVNRKAKRAVIGHLLKERIKSHDFCILDLSGLEVPKTKIVAHFLKSLGIAGQRVLFLDAIEGEKLVVQDCFSKSVRNLPKINYRSVHNINGYDLALHGNVVVTSKALDVVKEFLEGSV
jgi:large subunit ribosomal protein L4